MNPIAGERILLREEISEDLDAMHQWLSDPEVNRFLCWGTHTREETLVQLAEGIGEQFNPQRKKYYFTLALKDSGQVIGSTGIEVLNLQASGGEGEIGYFLNKSYWGRGYASEAVQLLLDFGFRSLNLHKISASCMEGNEASEQVMQRCGMQKEAQLRKSVFWLGKWQDRLIYSILLEEWLIQKIPGWKQTKEIKTEPLDGLTNKNFLVHMEHERFVLRQCGANTEYLEIDREQEVQALQAAARAGIGAEVVYSMLPQGHLITRFIEGRRWSCEEYRKPENLERMIATVKRIHALPPIRKTFSPFRRIEAYTKQARVLQASFPKDFDLYLQKMAAIEARQQQDSSAWLKFCHNDLYSVNFLDDGTVRVMDWEFAGMGDLYFDLAALVYAYDSDGPLPPPLEEYLLSCYFGEVTEMQRTRLRDMKYVLNFFTASWGLLHHGLYLQGFIPAVAGFNYLEYAQTIFDEVLKPAL